MIYKRDGVRTKHRTFNFLLRLRCFVSKKNYAQSWATLSCIAIEQVKEKTEEETQGSIASVVGRYLLKRKTTLRMFAKDAGARVFSTISLPPFYYTFLQRERAKKTAPRHHRGRKAESFWLEKVAAAAVEQQQFGSNYYARGKCSPSSPSPSGAWT